MADPFTVVMGVGMALSAVSTLLGARNQAAAGDSAAEVARQNAEITRQQAAANANLRRIEANEERALGQHRAAEERRQGRFVTSRAKAVGAASGTAIDPIILGDLEHEIEIRALDAAYGGESAAASLEREADFIEAGGAAEAGAIRNTGLVRQQAGHSAAAGTLLSGGSSLFNKFADRMPFPSSTTTTSGGAWGYM